MVIAAPHTVSKTLRDFAIRWPADWENAFAAIAIAATFHFSATEIWEMSSEDLAFWCERAATVSYFRPFPHHLR